ncbi:nitroreductase family deazaflavin-dependent oxidoreductase [Sciscionella marina]|uniref:nitroreductase family deazaflavin-dependent oxidoreductase n=1 Tax=Sciscionella marina TaxID=508770 RepID=UPI00037EE362|nr:nitroreductase family deazaflavin-dependent oxidoreductase [Sciscionella marina]
MQVIKKPAPPTGLPRLLFRLPIRLYRLRLGWLLGSRMLLLTHTGRVSGKPRQVVIEVVGRDERTGSYFTCSGFGQKSAWYRNVLATPQARIQVGNRAVPALAEPLETEDGAEVMADYAVRHPRAARRLVRFMGFAVDGTAEDYREVGRNLPFVRFTPE